MADVTQCTIESLKLSIRAQNCLTRAGIDTVEKLLTYTANDLSRLPWLGRVTLKELIDCLSSVGLALRQSELHLPRCTLETSMNEDFVEYFTLAKINALTERENLVIELRYGLSEDKAQTLEQIGKRIGVTRERIRQILVKSLSKILRKGKSQIRNNNLDLPCAGLLLYVERVIRPQEENAIVRLVDFIENDLVYMPENQTLGLLAYLAFQSKSTSKQPLDEARKLFAQRKNERIEINRKIYKQQLASDKFNNLLDFVLWPDEIRLLKQINMESLVRMRDVSMNGESNAGIYFSEKMRRNVQYESGMEYDFFQRLELCDEVTFFQEQPLKIPYDYSGKKQFYYPDVLFLLKDGRVVIVEIKPLFKMALHINLQKWGGLRIFCANNGFGLLVTDGRNSIQQIKHHNVNKDFSKDVLLQLQSSALTWSDYRKIRDNYKTNYKDFIALVINNKLIWELNPFALRIPGLLGRGN